MNITILTGAGVSAESGMKVFREKDGLWENHRIEDVATYEGYVRNKKLVHDFYNMLRAKVKKLDPNNAHIALAKLEQNWTKGKVYLITQNIDDLHERAGSKHVIHMHGVLNSMICEHCGKELEFFEASTSEDVCPHCGRALLRPNIVWFGEVPYYLDEIEQILGQTNVFLCIGTSGVVYPAAGFASLTKINGALNIEFNLEKSKIASDFALGVYGKAGETLPSFVDKLLEMGDFSFLNKDNS